MNHLIWHTGLQCCMQDFGQNTKGNAGMGEDALSGGGLAGPGQP